MHMALLNPRFCLLLPSSTFPKVYNHMRSVESPLMCSPQDIYVQMTSSWQQLNVVRHVSKQKNLSECMHIELLHSHQRPHIGFYCVKNYTKAKTPPHRKRINLACFEQSQRLVWQKHVSTRRRKGPCFGSSG